MMESRSECTPTHLPLGHINILVALYIEYIGLFVGYLNEIKWRYCLNHAEVWYENCELNKENLR